MIKCQLCGKEFLVITNTHLRAVHKTTIADYSVHFGSKGTGFTVNVMSLSKNDSRYVNWVESLAKRENLGWSKGYTKESHSSIAKISNTFKHRKIDNFAKWRIWARKNNIIANPLSLNRDGDLAFLIGLVLGDGNIYRFKRTECLRITLGTDKPNLWKYAVAVVEEAFGKRPTVVKVKNSKCMIITLYQKMIGERLGVPIGNRGKRSISVPRWILSKRIFMLRYLRGLYEAEGSFCVHKPTSTYKFLFSNKNKSLLRIVFRFMKSLGFHPHVSSYKVQISRKKEVYSAIKLLQFRQYGV
ncbi:MAG TPA: LAGLIDADG family homing endonuclease [Candidatus Paceibacterota bacterium]